MGFAVEIRTNLKCTTIKGKFQPGYPGNSNSNFGREGTRKVFFFLFLATKVHEVTRRAQNLACPQPGQAVTKKAIIHRGARGIFSPRSLRSPR
jgi:hypothetical protein